MISEILEVESIALGIWLEVEEEASEALPGYLSRNEEAWHRSKFSWGSIG